MTTAKIYQQIPKIMSELGPIAKKNRNIAQGYSFRGIDDIYEGVQAVLAANGVFVVPDILEERTEERTAKNGSTLIYRVLKIKYTFFADDGSSISATVIGEGMDSGDKASNKAMSVAQKYALIQVFCIPTVEPKDPENDSHEIEPAIYLGTEPHKELLRAAAKAAGFTAKEAPRMSQLHDECLDKRVKLEHLKAAAIEFLGYLKETMS